MPDRKEKGREGVGAVSRSVSQGHEPLGQPAYQGCTVPLAALGTIWEPGEPAECTQIHAQGPPVCGPVAVQGVCTHLPGPSNICTVLFKASLGGSQRDLNHLFRTERECLDNKIVRDRLYPWELVGYICNKLACAFYSL